MCAVVKGVEPRFTLLELSGNHLVGPVRAVVCGSMLGEEKSPVNLLAMGVDVGVVGLVLRQGEGEPLGEVPLV